MSDDDIVQRAERTIAAMTDEERHELLHRRDGYYVLARDYGHGRHVETFYKIEGVDQWRLVEQDWTLLGEEGTYKNEPAWWLISGEEDFRLIEPTALPPGAPTQPSIPE